MSLQRCAEYINYQLPNVSTCVNYLPEAINSNDLFLQAEIALVKADETVKKHKQRRSTEPQQNHKEKKREKRESTVSSTELNHKSNDTITLFLLLWFKTRPAEPLGRMYDSLIHSNTGWESLPERHIPYHQMVHLCHYGLAWDETCKMCSDILTLLGSDDKSCLEFGQNNYKPDDDINVRLPDLQ